MSLVDDLRALSRYENSDSSLGDDAANEIERLQAEVEALRDPRVVVQRALLIAAMLPDNETKTAGSLRSAAAELFGEATVADVLKEWRGAARQGEKT